MGVFNFIKNLFRPKVKDSITPTQTFGLSDTDMFYIDSINNELKLSAVYAAITTISSTMSKIPFFIIDSNTKTRVSNSDIYELLNVAPNSKMNACTMNELLMNWILIDGEAFVLPVHAKYSNKILKRIPFKKCDVTRIVDDTRYEMYYELTFPDGHNEIYNANEIEHYMAFTLDGITGLSPLEYARITVQSGLNQDEYNQYVYKNGCRPKDYISIDADLPYDSVKYYTGNDENGKPIYIEIPRRDAIRREWKKTKGDTAVLDRGMKYNTVEPISPEQMQFISSKEVTVQDIARFFGMGSCMFKLGVGKQSYSTNEQGQICFITEVIAPYLRKWEKELTLKLLTVEQRRKGWEIKGNLNAELRGDTAARLAWYKGMKEIGVYSINEIRDYEDLSNIGENGDVRTIGPNAVPLERAISGETAADVTPNNVNGRYLQNG